MTCAVGENFWCFADFGWSLGSKSGLRVPGLVLAAPICHGAQYCDEEGTAVVFGVLGDGL